MSEIRNTITSLVPSGYESYTEPVILALEAREQQLADSILRAAVEQGLRPGDVEDALGEIGMHLPVKTDEAPLLIVGTDTFTSEQLEIINAMVRNAVRDAERRHGLA